MSIINKKAEMTPENYSEEVLKDLLVTVCKWELSEEERVFIENY
jgi:hypothetical protein